MKLLALSFVRSLLCTKRLECSWSNIHGRRPMCVEICNLRSMAQRVDGVVHTSKCGSWRDLLPFGSYLERVSTEIFFGIHMVGHIMAALQRISHVKSIHSSHMFIFREGVCLLYHEAPSMSSSIWMRRVLVYSCLLMPIIPSIPSSPNTSAFFSTLTASSTTLSLTPLTSFANLTVPNHSFASSAE